MNGQLRQEVRFLTTRLGAMVRAQSGREVISAIEVLRKAARQIRQSPNLVGARHGVPVPSHGAPLRTKERALNRLLVEQAAAVGREPPKL